MANSTSPSSTASKIHSSMASDFAQGPRRLTRLHRRLQPRLLHQPQSRHRQPSPGAPRPTTSRSPPTRSNAAAAPLHVIHRSPPSPPAPASPTPASGLEQLRLSCAPATPRATPAPTRRSPASPRRPSSQAFALRVNVGGAAYTDSAAGNTWVADTGLQHRRRGELCQHAGDRRYFRSDPLPQRALGRRRRARTRYAFTVPNGNYLVRLHFAENNTWTFGVGLRVFSVQAEGSTAISNLDVYAAAGAHGAGAQPSTTVTDGQLNLGFMHRRRGSVRQRHRDPRAQP